MAPQAGTVKWLSLVKNGVTTHSFDSGQRLVDLEFTIQGDGTLEATIARDEQAARSTGSG